MHKNLILPVMIAHTTFLITSFTFPSRLSFNPKLGIHVHRYSFLAWRNRCFFLVSLLENFNKEEYEWLGVKIGFNVTLHPPQTPLIGYRWWGVNSFNTNTFYRMFNISIVFFFQIILFLNFWLVCMFVRLGVSWDPSLSTNLLHHSGKRSPSF